MASHYRIHGTVTDHIDIDADVQDRIERIIRRALAEAGFGVGGMRVAVARETTRARSLAKRMAERAPRVAAAIESLKKEALAKEQNPHFVYLEKLRKSCRTNMFGAARYLAAEFGLDMDEARKILGAWMDSYKEAH